MSMNATPPKHRACAALRAGALCAALGLALPWAAAQSGDVPVGKSREPVTLNFVNAEIEGVARAMAAIVDRQIVVDPRVRGQITLYSEQPLAPKDAYLSFLASLRGLGFTVVEVAGLLKVVPEAEGKLQTGSVSVGDVSRRGDQIVTQIFRLQHENANNLVTVLRPLISPNNTINANPGSNSLVITDYANNLQRIAKMIAALDSPSGSDVEVLPLQHAVASDLAPVIQKLSEATPGVPGAAAAGTLTVLSDSRTNTLVLRAGSPARLAQARSLVEKLDRPGVGGAGGSGIYVVYLKNADATRLAQVLRASFAGDARGSSGSGLSGAASLATPASTAQQQQQQIGASGATSNGTGASTQATSPVSAAAAPSTGGFVQADPATNSLIITAPEPLYRQLRAVIDQLDARRAQVYIETMLVEVNATKAADAGFQWQTLIGKDGDKYGVIGGTNFGTGGNNLLNLSIAAASGNLSGSNASLPSSGLNIGIVRKYGSVYGLSALARFLETNADGNILSTPNLVTLDNEEAKIVVGQNVPFVTGSFTSTGTGSGATNPFQTIERKDVGITLRVKPQIGENGTVRMVIYQEASSVVNQNVSQGVADATAGLVTNKRSIESTVVVDDGDILVLGGLMQDEYQNNQDRVPGLASIPGLGALFRNENRTRRKSNLMVFLRPQVMRSAEQTQAFSLDRYDLIRAQQKDTQPEPRLLLPINESPVLPPLRSAPGAPLDPPPTPPASGPVN
jgi:general secretion pathway protein D